MPKARVTAAALGGMRSRKTLPMIETVPRRARPGPTPPPTKPNVRPIRRERAATAKPVRETTHPLKERTPAILAVIERVRELALGLADTTEVIAWGEPTWRVGGKLFAMFDTHHHGSPHLSVWIPAPPGAQQALIESDPARFWRPPYVGHKGWVAVIVDDPDPPWDMIGSLIADAHRMIAPARSKKA
jgi:hypothetical protein